MHDVVEDDRFAAVADRIAGIVKDMDQRLDLCRVRTVLIAERRHIVLRVKPQSVSRLYPQAFLGLALQVRHQVKLHMISNNMP